MYLCLRKLLHSIHVFSFSLIICQREDNQKEKREARRLWRDVKRAKEWKENETEKNHFGFPFLYKNHMEMTKLKPLFSKSFICQLLYVCVIVQTSREEGEKEKVNQCFYFLTKI